MVPLPDFAGMPNGPLGSAAFNLFSRVAKVSTTLAWDREVVQGLKQLSIKFRKKGPDFVLGQMKAIG